MSFEKDAAKHKDFLGSRPGKRLAAGPCSPEARSGIQAEFTLLSASSDCLRSRKSSCPYLPLTLPPNNKAPEELHWDKKCEEIASFINDY